MQFSIVIGNPPYGSGGNDAIAFLNRSGDISDDVRYVLPLSLRKVSSQNKVRLDLVCVSDIVLPDSTFPGGIRAVRQNWINSALRKKIQTFTTHPDFEFVNKGDPTTNVFVMRSGYAGKVLTEGFEDYEWSHYFIYAKTPQVIKNLQSCETEFRELAKMTNGMDKLSKHELIETYIDHFDRQKINTSTSHPDFQFLTLSEKRDPSKRKKANLFIGEAGAGPSGRVKTENFMHYWDGHHFLYVESEIVKERLISLGDAFRTKAMNCNGRPHLSKPEIIEIYNLHFDQYNTQTLAILPGL